MTPFWHNHLDTTRLVDQGNSLEISRNYPSLASVALLMRSFRFELLNNCDSRRSERGK